MLEYVGAWTIQPPTLNMHLLMQIVEFILLFFFFFLQGKLNKESISCVKQIKFKNQHFKNACKINLMIW